jgi:pimeloyl-ACP methyl ester carboxylesterase
MFTSERLSEAPPQHLPTLAVVGEHDQEPFTEPSVRAGFAAAYSNFELFVCQNSGHYPMQETPVALASAINRFLHT